MSKTAYKGFDVDKDYCDAATKRLEAVKNQVSIFDLDKYESVFDAASDLKGEV